jgi:hypothetical protein
VKGDLRLRLSLSGAMTELAKHGQIVRWFGRGWYQAIGEWLHFGILLPCGMARFRRFQLSLTSTGWRPLLPWRSPGRRRGPIFLLPPPLPPFLSLRRCHRCWPRWRRASAPKCPGGCWRRRPVVAAGAATSGFGVLRV